MSGPLRSLSGLIDFECAARWGSFRLAARELHKTPSAISQQVRQLEDSLGLQLFARHPRNVVLTEKGRELASTVARVLGELQAKVGALQDGDEESVLRVTTTHSFAMKWLVPKLHRFTERHPELDLRVEASDQLASLDDGVCDVALRYGRVEHAQPADLLFREQWVVVHSPTLSTRSRGVSHPSRSALLRHPLLYEGTTATWLRMLDLNGIASRRLDFSRAYSHAGLLVQAAVAGLGVALVPHALAHEDLVQGRLTLAPFRPLASDYGYRLLRSSGKGEMHKVQHFTAWLRQETAEMLRAFHATGTQAS